MRLSEHEIIRTRKKKIIFITLLIFCLLFFVFNNIDAARATGVTGPCKAFCENSCNLDSGEEADFDNLCRSVGQGVCSCCGRVYKNNDNIWNCRCQNGENFVEDCRVGFKGHRLAVCFCCGDCTLNDVLYIGVTVADLILTYLGVVALAFFILGGIIWITSGGSQERVKKGMAVIKGAIIGMVIVIIAYSVVRVIMRDVLKVQKDYLPESSVIEYRTS